MQDWNVVVTIEGAHYGQASRELRLFGSVGRTGFYNVLVLRVADISEFMERLAARARERPALQAGLARVVPATQRFAFQSPEEFEERTRQAVEPWLADLAGRRFHVRMHRRGFKGQLSSQSEERFLDGHIIERTAAAGAPAQMDFDDPDYIVAVETVGQQAGLSLWSRAERERFPFLKLD